MENKTELNKRQQSIAQIAAFTATGNIEGLKQTLTQGLDNGLSINEIKEVLVQMYAYSGVSPFFKWAGCFYGNNKRA